jgi:hypothetical protein
MWWTFFIIILLISIFSSVALFYALRRINRYENVILDFQSIIDYASGRLKAVDQKGSFESDDEIGFIFEEIKLLQKSLDEIFELEQETDNGQKEG